MNRPLNTHNRWAHMRAPSTAELTQLARRTWGNAPATLRHMTGEIAIIVEEFPDEETLDEVGCETQFDIMGLLRDTDEGHLVLVLFRRAVLDYWVEQGDELSAILMQVMVHETAHRLELSDDVVAQLEAELEAANPAPPTVQ
ncbi:MAG: metallopeptidase family protein [Anderseniella sp.]